MVPPICLSSCNNRSLCKNDGRIVVAVSQCDCIIDDDDDDDWRDSINEEKENFVFSIDKLLPFRKLESLF